MAARFLDGARRGRMLEPSGVEGCPEDQNSTVTFATVTPGSVYASHRFKMPRLGGTAAISCVFSNRDLGTAGSCSDIRALESKPPHRQGSQEANRRGLPGASPSQNRGHRNFLQVCSRRQGNGDCRNHKKHCRTQADREEYTAKRNRPTLGVWSIDPLVPPSLTDAR